MFCNKKSEQKQERFERTNEYTNETNDKVKFTSIIHTEPVNIGNPVK